MNAGLAMDVWISGLEKSKKALTLILGSTRPLKHQSYGIWKLELYMLRMDSMKYFCHLSLSVTM